MYEDSVGNPSIRIIQENIKGVNRKTGKGKSENHSRKWWVMSTNGAQDEEGAGTDCLLLKQLFN